MSKDGKRVVPHQDVFKDIEIGITVAFVIVATIVTDEALAPFLGDLLASDELGESIAGVASSTFSSSIGSAYVSLENGNKVTNHQFWDDVAIGAAAGLIGGAVDEGIDAILPEVEEGVTIGKLAQGALRGGIKGGVSGAAGGFTYAFYPASEMINLV